MNTIKRLLENIYPYDEDPAEVDRRRFKVVVDHVLKNIHPSPWRARLDVLVAIAVVVLLGGVIALACIYS